MVPNFLVRFSNGVQRKMTKDFLLPKDFPDSVCIPITLDQMRDHASHLDVKDLESLLRSQDFPSWFSALMWGHNRLGHLPFDKIKMLAESGHLPRKYLELKGWTIICPSCGFVRQCRRAWGSKAVPKSIRCAKHIMSGACVSID